MLEIAVVIPTYGKFEYAANAIDSLYRNSIAYKPFVILVDDASPEWPETASIPPVPVNATLGQRSESEFAVHRFPVNGGLTRSWNYGLKLAASLNKPVTCVTNSDVYFPKGWDLMIPNALKSYALVGPTTNAPGSNDEQFVSRYSLRYSKLNNSKPEQIQNVQDELHIGQGLRLKETSLNGFCMIANTATWFEGRYDDENVFCPRNDFNSKGQRNPTPLMTLNEYELQKRWRAVGKFAAVCLGSYVFHYRAVSRGDIHKAGDWARLKEGSK